MFSASSVVQRCKYALKGPQRHILARWTFPVKLKQSQNSVVQAEVDCFSPDEITVAKAFQNSILKLSLA